MPKVKDFYHRIEFIDECLRNKGKKWSIHSLLDAVNEKLRDRFEETISKRTLQYAIEYLVNEKHAPVEKINDGGKVYYYYSDANYSIKNLPLSDEEIILLKDAVEVIKQIGNTSIAKDLVHVVSKLENSIAENAVSERSIIQFERSTAANGLQHIDNIFTGIKEKIVLQINYQPFGKEASQRLMHPYLLKEYRNRWFLIGREHVYDRICTFALDRMQSIKVSKETFKENDIFDPETYYNDLVGVTLPEGAQPQPVIFKVKKELAPYIKTKPLHFSQQQKEILADGSEIYSLTLVLNYELKATLMGYGCDLEVLAPAELRDEMKRVYKYGADMYF